MAMRRSRSLPDHYAALDLGPTCTQAAIKTAWKAAAKRWHPDRVEGAARGEGLSTEQIQYQLRGAAARFREARIAYDVLGTAAERVDYDAARRRESRAAVEAAAEADRRREDRSREDRWREDHWRTEQAAAERAAERARHAQATSWESARERMEHTTRAWREQEFREQSFREARLNPWHRAAADFVSIVTASWGIDDPWGSGPLVRTDVLLPLD